MSWTKRQFVEQAFDELGLASYDFDLQPEQLNSALIKLDAMMATWNALAIKINYPLFAESDMDDDTGVLDAANEAIYLNLALRLAGSLGKALTLDQKQNAKEAKDALMLSTLNVQEINLPSSLPIGAGNKTMINYIIPTRRNNIANLGQSVEFDNVT